MNAHAADAYAATVISSLYKKLIRPLNAARLGQDSEGVHQARVVSRRLRTAFAIFKDYLPEKKRKAFKRSIRRAAKVLGQARDLDTQIAFLEETAAGKSLLSQKSTLQFSPCLNPCYGQGDTEPRFGSVEVSTLRKLSYILKSRRASLQPRVAAAIERLEKEKTLVHIHQLIKKLSHSPRAQSTRALRSLAEKKISRRLLGFFTYEAFISRPQRCRELHKTRFAAKHLRYTLEIFRPLYGAGFDEFIKASHHIQNLLGRLHDFDVWIETLPQMFSQDCKRDPALERAVSLVVNHCRKLRAIQHKTFFRFWQRLRRRNYWDRLTVLLKSRPA